MTMTPAEESHRKDSTDEESAFFQEISQNITAAGLSIKTERTIIEFCEDATKRYINDASNGSEGFTFSKLGEAFQSDLTQCEGTSDMFELVFTAEILTSIFIKEEENKQAVERDIRTKKTSELSFDISRITIMERTENGKKMPDFDYLIAVNVLCSWAILTLKHSLEKEERRTTCFKVWEGEELVRERDSVIVGDLVLGSILRSILRFLRFFKDCVADTNDKELELEGEGERDGAGMGGRGERTGEGGGREGGGREDGGRNENMRRSERITSDGPTGARGKIIVINNSDDNNNNSNDNIDNNSNSINDSNNSNSNNVNSNKNNIGDNSNDNIINYDNDNKLNAMIHNNKNIKNKNTKTNTKTNKNDYKNIKKIENILQPLLCLCLAIQGSGDTLRFSGIELLSPTPHENLLKIRNFLSDPKIEKTENEKKNKEEEKDNDKDEDKHEQENIIFPFFDLISHLNLTIVEQKSNKSDQKKKNTKINGINKDENAEIEIKQISISNISIELASNILNVIQLLITEKYRTKNNEKKTYNIENNNNNNNDNNENESEEKNSREMRERKIEKLTVCVIAF